VLVVRDAASGAVHWVVQGASFAGGASRPRYACEGAGITAAAPIVLSNRAASLYYLRCHPLRCRVRTETPSELANCDRSGPVASPATVAGESTTLTLPAFMSLMDWSISAPISRFASSAAISAELSFLDVKVRRSFPHHFGESLLSFCAIWTCHPEPLARQR